MSGYSGPDLSSLGRIRARIQSIQKTIEGPGRASLSGKGRFVEVLAVVEESKAGTEKPGLLAEETSPVPGDVMILEDVSAADDQACGGINAIVRRKARQYDMDEALVRSVVRMESGGNPRAVSKAGAMGVMQLMPGTAEMLGVNDPFDPEQNVDGGIRYLKRLLERYSGDETKALAAYHSGPGNVDRYGGVPPHPAVSRYVKCVLAMTRQEREGP